jgi:tagatose 1,6-diphosphate aldolase
MILSPGKFLGMKRLSDQNGIFKMTAVDQRPPIKKPIADYLNLPEAPWKEVAKFKRMLIENLQSDSSALLLDPHYAIPFSMDSFDAKKGLVVTLEDSVFQETKQGRISSSIDNWTVAKIKRMGADAVKVLAWYRPDAGQDVLVAQKDYVQKVGEECVKHDILFLFELLVYPLSNDKDRTKQYIEMKNKKTDHVLSSVEEFSKLKYGVDVFKLESPVNADQVNEGDLNSFKEMGDLAGRPWVMLSAGAGKSAFKNVLRVAFKAGCSGFLAGRAIWLDAFSNYPDWEKINTELRGSSASYLSEISNLANQFAVPWNKHPCYSSEEGLFPYKSWEFRRKYEE